MIPLEKIVLNNTKLTNTPPAMLAEIMPKMARLIHKKLMTVTAIGRIRQVMRIEKWKEIHASDLPRWIETIGEIDAYCSLATFAYNHPDYIYPTIAAQSFHLQAGGLLEKRFDFDL